MRAKLRHIGRICTLLLVMSMIMTGIPLAFSRTAEASTVYQLGENVTGVLDGGVLTITGTGAMYDYSNDYEAIDKSPFAWNPFVTSIIIGEGVTSIGRSAFKANNYLRSVTMSNSVLSIGDYAFLGCGQLTEVNMSENITTIGTRVFEQCSFLANIYLPEGLLTIGESAFISCNYLTEIVIPYTVTSVGSDAFRDTFRLSKIICFAEGVTFSSSFRNAGVYITSMNRTAYVYPSFFPEDTTYGYDNTFTFVKQTLGESVYGVVAGDTHYVYGTGATYSHSNSPFKDVSGIRNIVFGKKVTSIGNQLFAELTEVSSLTIPANVTTIGLDAFRGMSALREITYLYNGNATVNEEAFGGTTSPVTLNAYSANKNAINKASSEGFTINLIDNPVYITHALASDTHSATVTVHAEADAFVETEISINDGEWTDYTSPFTIEANATIKARASYSGRFYEFSELYTISDIVPTPIVAYTIEHYKQELNGTYVKAATDNLTGTTGAAVTAAAKTYTGFSETQNHAGRVASGTISADGSTVLKLYYDRNANTVSFVNHNGTVLATEEVLYNDLASAPTNPTRAFHSFAGWFTDNETFSNEWNFAENQVTGNINLYAKWTRIPQSINRVNVDPETTIAVNGLNDKVRLPEADNANTADIVVFVRAEPIQVPDIIKDKTKAEMNQKSLTMLNIFDIGLYKRVTTYDGTATESEISNSDITGKITVQVPLTEEQAKKDNLAIAHVDDDGSVTIISGKIVTVGSTDYFEFETDHFSMYSLVEVEEVSIPKTGEIPYSAIGFALLLLAAVVYASKKRFEQENI